MGNVGSSIASGIGSAFMGIIMTIGGIATANPLLIGMGVASTVSGAVSATASGIAAHEQDKRAAGAENDAKNATRNAVEAQKNAEQATAFHLSEARTGAYGSHAQAGVSAFYSAVQSGAPSPGAAFSSSGLIPGLGDAFDKGTANTLDRNAGVSSGLRTMTDPIHRAIGLKKNILPKGAKDYLRRDINARPVYDLLDQNYNPAGAGRATIDMQNVQAQQGGAYSSQSRY